MIRRPSWSSVLAFVGRGFLILVFGAAGVAKWVDVGPLGRRSVEPDGRWALAQEWSMLFSVVELLISLSMLTRFWRIGALFGAGLGVVFLITVVVANWQGLDTSRCGCLGRLELELRDHLHLIGAIILVGIGCASLRGGAAAVDCSGERPA